MSNTITSAYKPAQANALSRPDQIKEGTTVLASMKFLGLGTLIELALVELDYEAAAHARFTLKDGTNPDGGDIYTGLDRFGRLIETLWKTTSTTLIQTTYGRNRVGGVVCQYNVKAHASSIATLDHYYWYDDLQQVTQHERGDLTPSSGPPYTGIDAATRHNRKSSPSTKPATGRARRSRTPPSPKPAATTPRTRSPASAAPEEPSSPPTIPPAT